MGFPLALPHLDVGCQHLLHFLLPLTLKWPLPITLNHPFYHLSNNLGYEEGIPATNNTYSTISKPMLNPRSSWKIFQDFTCADPHQLLLAVIEVIPFLVLATSWWVVEAGHWEGSGKHCLRQELEMLKNKVMTSLNWVKVHDRCLWHPISLMSWVRHVTDTFDMLSDCLFQGRNKSSMDSPLGCEAKKVPACLPPSQGNTIKILKCTANRVLYG